MFWQVTLVPVALVVLTCVAQARGWIDLTGRRTSGSGGGGVIGIIDEVFNPVRHESQVQLDRQSMLPAPAPIPGDGDRGVFGGTVHIELPPHR